MDDRGYVAQAFFDRLSREGVRFRVLGDPAAYPENAPPEAQIVVGPESLAAMPRLVGGFCHELDLQLVRLAPEDSRALRSVLAWSDEMGRPRFMSLRLFSHYCRGVRCYLRAQELLPGAAESLFVHALIDAVETGELSRERAAWLSTLWHEDPRGAAERIASFWPSSATLRMLTQAADDGEWGPVGAGLAGLRRTLRRAVWPAPGDVAARVLVVAANLVHPARASVAFLGRESPVRSEVLRQVARDLAPLELNLYEAGVRAGRDALRVVFDFAENSKKEEDIVAVDSARGLAATVVEVERAILRWLECRVERRYPDALVGENPVAARVLQFAVRHRIPLVQLFMNCAIRCRLGSPVLMPYPFGIVIEPGTRIGSRVTLMHQVSLLGGPVIEDNVTIGPGAKIVGPVRVGRSATIGPNAVVTEDVPSHDTVVVEKRRPNHRSVVNA
jgi:serine O-acetyltransferase